MSTQLPSLPPRKEPTATDVASESKYLADCTSYSPVALLVHLETFQTDHKHVFKSLTIDTPSEKDDELIETIDAESQIPIESTKLSRFVCQVCHAWLEVQHTSNSTCTGNDYLCHHYHPQGLGGYQCCGCQYTLSTEIKEPVVSMTIFKRLEATRVKARSFADLMQKKGEGEPTLVSTYTTVLVYIKDLLSGVKRNINTGNPHFLARIGLSDGSQALLEDIGFQLQDSYFVAPDIEKDSPAEDRLRQVQQEIIVALDRLRQELGSTTVPLTQAESNMKVKTADMQQLLGIEPTLENRYTSASEYVNKAYASFGLTSGASDTLVSWAYKKTLSEPCALLDGYDAMDNLMTIANHTNSVLLQTLIACERSQGKIGRNDIGDAYAYFGVTEDSVDDKLLIGLYQVKLSDEPKEKSTIQDRLKTIAIARNSSELIDFLKEEKGITSDTNVQSVEDMMGVPAHMINNPQATPVGLNNIGNTCYFNSLLQYYYTLLPFRNTMIDNEDFVEDENSEPKKIGGIEVDRSEIRRAKKFVRLLKELFLSLQHTKEKAISPEYDLAYMALLNEKDSDDKSEQQEEENKQQEENTQQDEGKQQEETVDQVEDAVEKPVVDTDMAEAPASDNDSSIQENERPDSPPPAYADIATPEQVERTLTDIKPSSSSSTEPSKAKERPSVDAMMFGKQQDVTECMGNVMYLVEAALKPLHKTEDGEQVDDMIRQCFYGKARQILSYCDDKTQQTVKKDMEEDFSHVIVDASEGKDLYDGLDEYFFAEKVENFQGGREATREVSVKSFPPILQILVQRVQFDRATANVYKSNAYIQFEKVIYLDRYSDDNFEDLKDRRMQVAAWRSELEGYKKQVDKCKNSEISQVSIPDLMKLTSNIIAEFRSEASPQEQERFQVTMDTLSAEAEKTQHIIDHGTAQIQSLKQKIQNQYNDYTKLAYHLHAVFIHQGQANYGHYWIYILDHRENQWWKYNDSLVTKVSENEIYSDTTGSTANPYFLVYVDASKMDELVETIPPMIA